MDWAWGGGVRWEDVVASLCPSVCFQGNCDWEILRKKTMEQEGPLLKTGPVWSGYRTCQPWGGKHCVTHCTADASASRGCSRQWPHLKQDFILRSWGRQSQMWLGGCILLEALHSSVFAFSSFWRLPRFPGLWPPSSHFKAKREASSNLCCLLPS